jgi:hypothetical protein
LAIQELVFEKLGIFSDEDRKRFINSDSIKMLRPDIEDLLNQKIEEAEIITRLAEKYENWDKEK